MQHPDVLGSLTGSRILSPSASPTADADHLSIHACDVPVSDLPQISPSTKMRPFAQLPTITPPAINRLTKPRRQPPNVLPRKRIGGRDSQDLREASPKQYPVDDLGHPSRADLEQQQALENPFETPGSSPQEMAELVTSVGIEPRYDPDSELELAGKGKVRRQKVYLIAALASVNFLFIFATWWWPRYYYIYLPCITVTVFLNALMACSIIFFSIKHRIFPEKKVIPEDPETMVFIVPCYNETREELTRSLDSLINQTEIDQHPRAIMIICDGKVRGPGMEKTTAEYLFDDILTDRKSRHYIKGAYRAWTQELMDVEVQSGTFRGIPYYCIIKQRNQGKRDSLIVLRSFLHKYNIRAEHPQVIFSQQFFGDMASFLAADARLQSVTHLIGMDADTVFADECISELLKESRYPHTVGVCGYVAVDFFERQWGLWNLYQSAEYTISQSLRRFHQSNVTKKVSCLPGCCQLLRVCETTCGDHILIDLFGYCPKPTDSLLKHIRSTASEDRNHVCLMLSAFPKAQTRQAIRARAYTAVPQSWSVFLSQRRRWTLGATSNDLLLITSPGIYWFERILALANCLVWFINIFVFASLANLIKASLTVAGWIILCFSAIMLVPVIYYLCIVIWVPRSVREKVRYLIGLFIYLICGPFLNIIVLFYALWNMDSFGWGKTRKVVSDVSGEKTVVVPVDEEKEIGLRTPQQAVSVRETVITLGCSPYAFSLARAVGKYYRSVIYYPSEEILASGCKRLADTDYDTIETTADDEQLARAKIFLIAAPVTYSNERGYDELQHLRTAIAKVAQYVKPGGIVMIESTVPVGTTRSLLSKLDRQGIVCGFSSAFPSMPFKRDFTGTNKIISALNGDTLSLIEKIYRLPFPNTVSVAYPEIAEMLHQLQTVHRNCQDMLPNQRAENSPNWDRMDSELRKVSSVWKNFARESKDAIERVPAVR